MLPNLEFLTESGGHHILTLEIIKKPSYFFGNDSTGTLSRSLIFKTTVLFYFIFFDVLKMLGKKAIISFQPKLE